MTAALLRGPDVSNYQGVVNWTQVARTCAFGFAKATEGTGFRDPYFGNNAAGMRRAGLDLRGYYHFARGGDPRLEAHTYLDQVDRHGGFPAGTVAVLDAEVPLNAHAATWIDAWAATVRAETGLPRSRVIVYSYTGWFDQESGAELARHPLWLASYSTYLSRPHGSSWVFWQYTDHEKIEGIAGRVDCSVFHGTRAQLLALGGVKTLTKTKVGAGAAAAGLALGGAAGHTTHKAPAPKPRPVVVVHHPVKPTVHRLAFPLHPHSVYSRTSHHGDHAVDRANIRQIQRWEGLRGKAVDGQFGKATAARTVLVQKHLHLPATGKVNATTWSKIQ